MVQRLFIHDITAIKTLPQSSYHLSSHAAPVSHITQDLISPSHFHPSPAITPVFMSAQCSFIWASGTITASGCVMSRQCRCMHGSERANSRVSRVVLSSLAKTAVLCSADSADVMAVEQPVQPRQSRQSLQTRGIITTLTVLIALTQR